MKITVKTKDEKAVLALSGFFIVVLISIQKAYSIDLSYFIFCIGINQIQKDFTGWCPFAAFFKKIN
jgi:hypothetical protein